MTTTSDPPSTDSGTPKPPAGPVGWSWFNLALVGALITLTRQIVGIADDSIFDEDAETILRVAALALAGLSLAMLARHRHWWKPSHWIDALPLPGAGFGFAWIYPSLTDQTDQWFIADQAQAASLGGATAMLLTGMLLLITGGGSQDSGYRLFGFHGLLVLAGDTLCPEPTTCGLVFAAATVLILIADRAQKSTGTTTTAEVARGRHPGMRVAAAIALVVAIVAAATSGQRDPTEATWVGVAILAISSIIAVMAILHVSGALDPPEADEALLRHIEEHDGLATPIEPIPETGPAPAVRRLEPEPSDPVAALSEDEAAVLGPVHEPAETSTADRTSDRTVDEIPAELRSAPVAASFERPWSAVPVVIVGPSRDEVIDHIDRVLSSTRPQPMLVVLATAGGSTVDELADMLDSELHARLTGLLGRDELVSVPENHEIVAAVSGWDPVHINDLAAAIEGTLANPVDVGGDTMSLASAVGITAATAADANGNAALIRARVALYEARARGENRAAAWLG